MNELLDVDRFPLDGLDGARGRALLAHCRKELHRTGMFNLEGLVRGEALGRCIAEVEPVLASAAFTHAREHNVYFEDEVPHLDPDHPALRRMRTVNHTVCADQIRGGLLARIYEWEPLIDFVAAATGKPRLYPMADPLARINVMAYRAGEALNWHFDRSEFTTTILLQAPLAGGAFQYRSGLRSDSEPNHEGVGRLLAGEDDGVRTLELAAGTLNVFRGKNTAHRVTAVEGGVPRIVAVLSYYETPGVSFTEAERFGFYGRTGA